MRAAVSAISDGLANMLYYCCFVGSRVDRCDCLELSCFPWLSYLLWLSCLPLSADWAMISRRFLYLIALCISSLYFLCCIVLNS